MDDWVLVGPVLDEMAVRAAIDEMGSAARAYFHADCVLKPSRCPVLRL